MGKKIFKAKSKAMESTKYASDRFYSYENYFESG